MGACSMVLNQVTSWSVCWARSSIRWMNSLCKVTTYTVNPNTLWSYFHPHMSVTVFHMPIKHVKLYRLNGCQIWSVGEMISKLDMLKVQFWTQRWSPRFDLTPGSRDICKNVTPQSIWIHCSIYGIIGRYHWSIHVITPLESSVDFYNAFYGCKATIFFIHREKTGA